MTNSTFKGKAFPRQAVLLAAGLGTRLRPLTEQIPKPALPVGGVPILFFNLYLLQRAGIRHVVINLHHRPKTIKDLLKHSRKLGLNIDWSFEKKILGTAGGIAKALRKLKSELTFILNGDILVNLDFKKMLESHRRRKAAVTLAVVSPKLAKVRSFVEYDERGKIFRIGGLPKETKKPKKIHRGIFAGAHLVEPDLFAGVAPAKYSCVIRDVYQRALQENVAMYSHIHHGYWWDLGRLSSLKIMDQSLWAKTAPPQILQLWHEVRKFSQPLITPQL